MIVSEMSHARTHARTHSHMCALAVHFPSDGQRGQDSSESYHSDADSYVYRTFSIPRHVY